MTCHRIRTATLLGLCLALAGPDNGVAAAQRLPDTPFGIHGPTYSHWLAEERPNLWEEGEAFLNVWAGTGATWARQDFWWSQCEPRPGEFVWDGFDRAVDAYERAGVNVFAILCYGSAWSKGVSPQTDEDRAAFGRYVYEMVRRYKGRVGAWEIWNEPNIQPFWEPRPDPELYTKLLKTAYENAKKADPNCVIVGGAMAGPDLRFLEGMYTHGAKDYMDVLSYHNYGQESDMLVEWPALQAMREVMKKHGDADKPIWHTETGFYTGPVGLSEHDQASRIVRYSVGLLAMGLQKTFQLALADGTDDPNHPDRSIYRGLTHMNYPVKPSYAAYRTLCERLGDKRFAGIVRPAAGVWGFLFENPRESVLVLWRDWGSEPVPANLALDTPVALVQQLDGDWKAHREESGRYSLPISSDPVYVLNPGPAIRRAQYVRWSDPLRDVVPRAANATVTVDVSNPRPESTDFVLSIPKPPGEKATRVEFSLPANGTQSVALPLDTSRAEIGPHDVSWELLDGEGRVFAAGWRWIEVASPLKVFFGPVRHLSADAPRLPLVMEYHGIEPTKASASLKLGGEPTGEPVDVSLEPGSSRTVELPLKPEAFQGGRSLPIEAVVRAEGIELTVGSQRRLLPCPKAPDDVQLDGKLDEWQARPPTIRPDMMTWAYTSSPQPPGPEDLTVRGWLAWNEQGLWVALEVKDDVLVFPRDRTVWNYDSVQVALDMGSDARPDQPFDNNDIEIELGYNPDGPVWCYLGHCPPGWPEDALSAKLKAVVRPHQEQGVVVYELLIPADLLVSTTKLEPGTVVGFSLLVNDNDGAGRAGWQELTPGIGHGKRPADFAWLWLQ